MFKAKQLIIGIGVIAAAGALFSFAGEDGGKKKKYHVIHHKDGVMKEFDTILPMSSDYSVEDFLAEKGIESENVDIIKVPQHGANMMFMGKDGEQRHMIVHHLDEDVMITDENGKRAASYDGMPRLFANACAHSTDGTRRRVHSPSWATRISVTSLTAVRGSTNPSTPRRVVANSVRCFSSALSDGRTVVGPRPPGRGRRLGRRRNRSSRPMGTSVTHRSQHGRPTAPYRRLAPRGCGTHPMWTGRGMVQR